MGFPPFRRRTNEFHHPLVLALGYGGTGQIVPVGLVDHNGIGQFHNPLFDPLQIIPRPGQDEEHEEIDHVADRRFRLSDADRFDKDDIISCRFAQHHRFSAFPGDPAQGSLGRGRPDEAVWFPRQVLHSRLIPQNGTACQGTRRIDSQNGHMIPHVAQ